MSSRSDPSDEPPLESFPDTDEQGEPDGVGPGGGGGPAAGCGAGPGPPGRSGRSAPGGAGPTEPGEPYSALRGPLSLLMSYLSLIVNTRDLSVMVVVAKSVVSLMNQ